MPRTCTACRHPERAQLDRDLVSGHGTFRGLATTYALSASAVRRHRRDHIAAVLTQAHSLDEIAAAESLADHVRTLRARTLSILARAEANSDAKTELAALRELRALAELEARGADRDATVIHVSIVQQYVHRVIAAVREFVPAERVDAAIARIESAIQHAGDTAPSLLSPPEDNT